MGRKEKEQETETRNKNVIKKCKESEKNDKLLTKKNEDDK